MVPAGVRAFDTADRTAMLGNRRSISGVLLLNDGQQGGRVMSGVTAERETTFLLARPEQKLLEAIARRLPAFVRPDHLTALALVAAVAFAVFAALRGVLGRGGAARRALVRRLARRDAGARAPRRAAALRLLPRPPRGRVRDGAGRPRAGPVGAHAPGRRAGARDRLPGALDQLLPGDAGARAVLAGLRAARADRGAARADRAAGRGRRWASRSPCSGSTLLDVVALGGRA